MFVNKISLLLAATFSVHTSASVCVNSDDFRYFYDGKDRTCRNIRINEDRRQALCIFQEVNDACPQACGKCCEDIEGYTFTRLNGLEGTCDWLAAKTVRQDRYCDDIKKVFNGRTVRDGCPKACDFCKTEIFVATVSPAPTVTASEAPSGTPTAAPSSTPSSAPTGMPSGTPTSEPTRPPSPMPSPFPTLRPTSAPSESPSDEPSLSPSDAPSMQPSKSPSDVPSMQPSSMPSDVPSMQPSSMPSMQPSKTPSDVPSMQPSSMPSMQPSKTPSDVPSAQPSDVPSDLPSLAPSDQPSNNPTMSIKPSPLPSTSPTGETPAPTKAPTTTPSVGPSVPPVASTCANDISFTWTLKNEPSTVTCTWLVQNSKKVDQRRKNYCVDGSEVKEKCPLGCGDCVGDDPEFKFKLDNFNKKVGCAWITRNQREEKLKARMEYCEKKNVAAACNETCT